MRKNNFYKQPVNKRIEAVIADGQWYFFDKWRKVSKVTEEELKNWINDNIDDIIIDKAKKSNKNKDEIHVYRVNAQWIKKWYKENNIPLDREIVPKNYPVRLWDDKTETQHFIDNPPQFTSKVKVESDFQEVLDKLRDLSLGLGYIETSIDNPNELIIYCIDADYVSDMIKKELTTNEIKKTKIGVRRGYWNRDLSEFSEEFLTGMYLFYLPYSRNLLVKAEDTMNMFLENREEKDVRIIKWITIAMEKYDQSKNIPFSGYLASMLAKRPYELPDEYYGRTISKFKNNKSRAEERLSKRFNDSSFTDKQIAQEMGLDMQEYKTLNNEFITLENFRNATHYEWESAKDNSISDNTQKDSSNNFKLAHEISKAALKAYIETGMVEDTIKLVNKIGNNESSITNLNLSQEYKLSLAKHLEDYYD